jgi:hypothetical protein
LVLLQGINRHGKIEQGRNGKEPNAIVIDIQCSAQPSAGKKESQAKAQVDNAVNQDQQFIQLFALQ